METPKKKSEPSSFKATTHLQGMKSISEAQTLQQLENI